MNSYVFALSLLLSVPLFLNSADKYSGRNRTKANKRCFIVHLPLFGDYYPSMLGKPSQNLSCTEFPKVVNKDYLYAPGLDFFEHKKDVVENQCKLDTAIAIKLLLKSSCMNNHINAAYYNPTVIALDRMKLWNSLILASWETVLKMFNLPDKLCPKKGEAPGTTASEGIESLD